MSDCCDPFSKRTSRIERVMALLLLTLIVIGGIVFMAISYKYQDDSVWLKTYSCVGDPSLVYPGPGAPTTAYEVGDVTFNINTRSIQVRAQIGGVGFGSLTGIQLIGPTLNSNPISGPTLLPMCGPGSPLTCNVVSANLVDQTTSKTPLGQPLDDLINDVVRDRFRYMMLFQTTTYPQGALACRFL
jgi:hypothetical protein